MFREIAIRTAKRQRSCAGNDRHRVPSGSAYVEVTCHGSRQAYCRECAYQLVGTFARGLKRLLTFVSS